MKSYHILCVTYSGVDVVALGSRAELSAASAVMSCGVWWFEFIPSDASSVDLHPTEPWVLASLFSGQLYIWNVQTQTLVKSVEVAELPGTVLVQCLLSDSMMQCSVLLHTP
jgi:hypothetical protein